MMTQIQMTPEKAATSSRGPTHHIIAPNVTSVTSTRRKSAPENSRNAGGLLGDLAQLSRAQRRGTQGAKILLQLLWAVHSDQH